MGEVETALRRAGKGYGLGATANDAFWSWRPNVRLAGEASAIADGLPSSAWLRLSAGRGTKGEQLYDWIHQRLADRDAADHDASVPELWTRGMLVRRSVADGERVTTTWAPHGTFIETPVRVEGARRRVEEGFETTKLKSGSITTKAGPGTRAPARLARHDGLCRDDGRASPGQRHQAEKSNTNVRSVGDMPSSAGRSSKSAASSRTSRNA